MFLLQGLTNYITVFVIFPQQTAPYITRYLKNTPTRTSNVSINSNLTILTLEKYRAIKGKPLQLVSDALEQSFCKTLQDAPVNDNNFKGTARFLLTICPSLILDQQDSKLNKTAHNAVQKRVVFRTWRYP